MNRVLPTLLLAATALCTPAAESVARGSHFDRPTYSRHAGIRRASPRPAYRGASAEAASKTNPYADYHGPGSAVLNATERAKGEPGVIHELAPDAKETATGGPVGGPPGFDGS